jgi:hypothetical protein
MPWLRQTGQAWKVRVLWVGMLGPYVLAKLRVPIFRDVGYLFSLAFFVWFLLAVRCPRCRGRPVWMLATRVKAREFGRALVGAERCPLCHDGVEPPRQAPPLFSAFRDL